MDERRVFVERADCIGDGGQLFVHDVDQLERGACDVRRVCRDNGNSITDVAHLVPAEHRPVQADEPVQLTTRHIFVCQDRAHASERPGR